MSSQSNPQRETSRTKYKPNNGDGHSTAIVAMMAAESGDDVMSKSCSQEYKRGERVSLNGRRETSTTMTTVAAATYVDAIDGGGKREVQQTANGDNSATDGSTTDNNATDSNATGGSAAENTNCINKNKNELTTLQREGEGAYVATFSLSSLTRATSYKSVGALATY